MTFVGELKVLPALARDKIINKRVSRYDYTTELIKKTIDVAQMSNA